MQMVRHDETGPDGAEAPVRRVRPDDGPERRCIVTRAVKPKDELLRFVRGPDGTLIPDLAQALPGRGLYVVAYRDVLAKACAKNAFARAARESVVVPEDLVDRVAGMLAQRCIQLLGFARRAGQATAGFESVREWLRDERAGMLIEASDGSAGGRGKLRGLAAGLPTIELLTAAELGLAFGRDHAVHVAVRPGGFARRLAIEFSRLAGFRAAEKKRENE